ncbi:MAG: HepT-like ribonuclease domain-containing protein [Patescibacteria group bacterium]
MKELNINKKTIEEKIKLIETHLVRLKEMKSLSLAQVAEDKNFAYASWNLRGALESLFSICTHVLSRIPGIKIDEYKQMAVDMGKQGIVPRDFAENTLVKMAKYRNRLTHFYFEVTPEEMYGIIQNNLEDFEIFMRSIKKLLAS